MKILAITSIMLATVGFTALANDSRIESVTTTSESYYETESCLPGQDCDDGTSTSNSFSYGTVSDFFNGSTDPDCVEVPGVSCDTSSNKVYTAATVNEILAKCKENPTQCGIEAVSETTTNVEDITSILAGNTYDISGYYINYDTSDQMGSWVYVDRATNVMMKFEPKCDAEGKTRWTQIYNPYTDITTFSSLNIIENGTKVEFGSAIILPGQ